jgi:D-serine deaminase-like pyridoxal phosphate-dependent protein
VKAVVALEGLPIEALPTPAALVDRDRLEANCRRMRARCDALGVRLRPHLKTAKCVEVAALSGDVGAVSTLEEAAWFLERGGPGDLVYARGVTPRDLPRVRALREAGLDLAILVDDLDVARAVREAALGDVAWIEVDSGQGRGGVRPEAAALLDIGRVLERPRGVLTHAGQSYGARGADALRAVAETERAAAVGAAERLREAGVPCPEVSVGSTPTLTHAAHLDGVTEARAGVYVFGDLFQASLGSCRLEDLALSVLTRVVSRGPDHVWVDAGALALSQDRSLAAFGDAGYGWVCDLQGRRIAGARVDVVNQAHGRVVGLGEAPPVGTPLRVLPVHACHTAAMHGVYGVVEGGEVVEQWTRLRG